MCLFKLTALKHSNSQMVLCLCQISMHLMRPSCLLHLSIRDNFSGRLLIKSVGSLKRPFSTDEGGEKSPWTAKRLKMLTLHHYNRSRVLISSMIRGPPQLNSMGLYSAKTGGRPRGLTHLRLRNTKTQHGRLSWACRALPVPLRSTLIARSGSRSPLRA